jgi:hypothetical protein
MRPTPSVVDITNALIDPCGYDTPVTHHNAPVPVSTTALKGYSDCCTEVLGHKAYKFI